jgi:cytochrome c-type biogenesis protein CcmE
MKPSSVAVLILLAITTAIFISTLSNPESYADFTEAYQYPEQEFTVVGNLVKQKGIQYQPTLNPNLVSFYMIDKKGKESLVLLNQPKPQDIERSEDIVIKGQAQEDHFKAHTILLKCPSKYEEQQTFTSQIPQ